MNYVVSVKTKRRNKPLWRNKSSIRYSKKHKNFSLQTYSFLEVKLRRHRRKTFEEKYVILDKNQVEHTVLANSSNSNSRARVTIYIFTENFDILFCEGKYKFKD